jgi:DedD protein
MDKEMKKLLLVAVSVGFFLLVTITAAIIILTPKTTETQFSSPVTTTGRVQMTQMNETPPANINQQPSIIDSQGISPNSNISPDIVDGDGMKTISMPSTIITKDSNTALQTGNKETEIPVVATVKRQEPAPTVKPQATSAQRTTTTPAARPAATAAKPAVSAKVTNDFWVQTGAFSAQIRAEDARDVLSDKGITSIIENREINGKIWYRVRLGPYTSEKEANHWLEIVKLIDGFSGSQVRQTVRAN